MQNNRRSILVFGVATIMCALGTGSAFAAKPTSDAKIGSGTPPSVFANVLLPWHHTQNEKCKARLALVSYAKLDRFLHHKNHVVSVPLVNKYGEYLGTGKYEWGGLVTQGRCKYSAVVPAIPAYMKWSGVGRSAKR
jgi:hypothetical protein